MIHNFERARPSQGQGMATAAVRPCRYRYKLNAYLARGVEYTFFIFDQVTSRPRSIVNTTVRIDWYLIIHWTNIMISELNYEEIKFIVKSATTSSLSGCWLSGLRYPRVDSSTELIDNVRYFTPSIKLTHRTVEWLKQIKCRYWLRIWVGK